jgi:hypothetical protein
MITVAGLRAADFGRHRLQLAERPLGPFRRQLMLPRGARAVAAAP